MGTPAIVPESAFRARPLGSAPDATDQVADPRRPLTLADNWYGAPTCPAGGVGTVTTSGGGSMVTDSVAVALFDEAWLNAETVSDPVSTRVGVPTTAPAVASKLRPAGNELSTSCQTHGPDPPVQVSVWA